MTYDILALIQIWLFLNRWCRFHPVSEVSHHKVVATTPLFAPVNWAFILAHVVRGTAALELSDH
jgi:hypothetical protein